LALYLPFLFLKCFRQKSFALELSSLSVKLELGLGDAFASERGGGGEGLKEDRTRGEPR